MVASGWSLCFAWFALVACSGLPRTPAPPPPVEVHPTAPPDHRWRPLEAPPCYLDVSREQPRCEPGTSASPTVLLDAAGTRWLHGATIWRRADTPMPLNTRLFLADARLGVIALDTSDQLWRAADPLGPFQPLAWLPDYIHPRWLTVHAGGFNGAGAMGVFWSADGVAWQRLAPLGDRAALMASIGADGSGVGIFVPQRIGVTRDGGRSFTALAADAILADAIGEMEDGTTVIESRSQDDSHPTAKGIHALCWRTEPDRLEPCTPPSRLPKWADTSKTTSKDDLGKRDDYQLPSVVLGDTVIAYRNGGEHARILRRKLGEGWSESRSAPACDRNVALSVCGETLVVACGNHIHVEGHGKLRDFEVPSQIESVALSAPGKLWLLEWDQLRSLDLDAPGLALGTPLALGSVRVSQLVSTCSPASPHSPVYLLDGNTVRGWLDLANPPRARAFTSDLPRIDDSAVAAVDSRGRLVYVTADRTVQLARIAFDGAVERIDVPWSLAESDSASVLLQPRRFRGPLNLSSLREGRALVLDQTRAHQTLDDGAHWTTVAPPFPRREDPAHVLCGTTRCEADTSVFREGWPTSDVAPPPAAARYGGKAPEHASPRDSSCSAFVLGTCERRAPLGQCAEVPVLARGLGDALFSGICAEEIGQGVRNYTAFHGYASQRMVRRSFQVRDTNPQEDPTIIASWVIGLRLKEMSPLDAYLAHTKVPPIARPYLLVSGPGSPLSRATQAPDKTDTRFELDDGFVRLEPKTKSLEWHHRGAPVERRAAGEIASILSSHTWEGVGTLVADPQGDWTGAFLDFSRYASGGTLLLFRVPKSGEPKFRWLIFKTPYQLEWGMGLEVRQGTVHLAAVETLPNGGAAVRLRPIAVDLDLGDAVELAGGAAKPGHLIDPPACAAAAVRGTHVLTSSIGSYAVATDAAAQPDKKMLDAIGYADPVNLKGVVTPGYIVGPLVRDLRIQGNAVCAERTTLGGNTLHWAERRRSAVLVGAGNGQGIAASATHWWSCRLDLEHAGKDL